MLFEETAVHALQQDAVDAAAFPIVPWHCLEETWKERPPPEKEHKRQRQRKMVWLMAWIDASREHDVDRQQAREARHY